MAKRRQLFTQVPGIGGNPCSLFQSEIVAIDHDAGIGHELMILVVAGYTRSE